MENIPDYVNDANNSIRLLKMTIKFSDSFPIELNSIITDLTITTSQKFNISKDIIEEIVLDKNYMPTNEKDKNIINYFDYELEKALLSRL